MGLVHFVATFLNTTTTTPVTEKNILSLAAIDPITVPFNTDFEDLDLPETILATFDQGSPEEVNIEWVEGEYDQLWPDTYTLYATVIETETIQNPDEVRAEIEVEVETVAAPIYASLSSIELIVDYTGLVNNTTNDYGIVSSGSVTTLKSLAPGPTGRNFTSNGTAPTLVASGISFGGAGRLRHSGASTWNPLSYNATEANLKSTYFYIVKIATSANPGASNGLIGNNGSSAASKGITIFAADNNSTGNAQLLFQISNGTVGNLYVSLALSDVAIFNDFFLLTVVVDAANAAATKAKFRINGKEVLNTTATSALGLVTTPTYDMEIGGCGNATLSLTGIVKEINIQSAINDSLTLLTHELGLMNKHGITPFEVVSVYNIFSEGRYPITHTLFRSINDPNLIADVVSDFTLGHSWRSSNIISQRISTDKGETWGSKTTLYTDAVYGTIESGGGVDPTDGKWYLFFAVFSGSGTTPTDDCKMLLITSEDDGETWSTPEDLTSLITNPVWPYGGLIRVGDVLMKPFYAFDGIGDTNPNELRQLRKVDGGSWASVLVEANTTNIRDESEIIGLGGDNVLQLTRDDTTFEWRQYQSTDKGANWTNHGAQTFGLSLSSAGPPRLKKVVIEGVDVILALIVDRSNRRCMVVAGTAANIIENNLTGFVTASLITYRQWSTTGPVQMPQYGDMVFFEDDSLEGLVVFTIDDGTFTTSTTSDIRAFSFPSWLYNHIKSALGL